MLDEVDPSFGPKDGSEVAVLRQPQVLRGAQNGGRSGQPEARAAADTGHGARIDGAQAAEDKRASPEHPRFPYLLRKSGDFKAQSGVAADITYIPMARGSAYLVAIID